MSAYCSLFIQWWIKKGNIQHHHQHQKMKLRPLSKHYDMVEGAQLSNSFVILMALDQSKIGLTTNQISETISKRSKGEIYKNPGMLKDAIDKRLKREGYVNSTTAASKTLY